MKKFLVCFIVALMSGVASFANDEHEEDRVKDAGVVLKEILNIPDDLPQDLLDKAECLVILPSVKKGAFGIGGSYGRGVMVCRSGEHYKGKWGAPALYALEGVSIGFQLGGQATDFVLLVMNPKGAGSLLYSKVKLGADASAAAGPKGRTAEGATDIVMDAEHSHHGRRVDRRPARLVVEAHVAAGHGYPEGRARVCQPAHGGGELPHDGRILRRAEVHAVGHRERPRAGGSHIPVCLRERELRELVKYPEDTAGGMMTTDYVWIYPHRTTEATIRKIREIAPVSEFIYYLYVLDKSDHVLGVLSLRTLLLALPTAFIERIMDTDLVTVAPDTPAVDVASTIAKYDLLAVPVVDDAGKLLGIVTVDDAIDAIMPDDIAKKLPHLRARHHLHATAP